MFLTRDTNEIHERERLTDEKKYDFRQHEAVVRENLLIYEKHPQQENLDNSNLNVSLRLNKRN